MQIKTHEELWSHRAASVLVGRTIMSVRYLTAEERDELGWYNASLVLLLDDGNYFYPSADDEGNNAGALFTSFKDLETIPVI